MIYYHLSQRIITPKSILTEGVYGERIIEMKARNYQRYIVENLFETVRKTHYPNLPSRFDCCFLYPTLEIATSFWANQFRYKAYLYEVEVLEGKQFIAEMDLLACENATFEDIQANAHQYWQQYQHTNSYSLEVLVQGKVKVTKVVYEPSVVRI